MEPSEYALQISSPQHIHSFTITYLLDCGYLSLNQNQRGEEGEPLGKFRLSTVQEMLYIPNLKLMALPPGSPNNGITVSIVGGADAGPPWNRSLPHRIQLHALADGRRAVHQGRHWSRRQGGLFGGDEPMTPLALA